ncbi:MAG: hypothetical protein K2N54_02945, partial [Helicobacter sp.]|nr:hypothetical protein [Helicobacter sp.]
MKIEGLGNEQVALSVSKQQDYVQIKKYEPYGEPVDKATITTITEDMYVDWEVSSAYQDNITGFLQSIRDCCQHGIYAKEDIEKYQGFIERQNEFEKIEPSNKYYDNRVVNGLDRKFDSSKLIAYDASNSQIPQKSKRFPFWIEVHTTETNYVSLHICFRADTVSLLGEHLHFILDTKSKYVILEACRVFAAMRNVFAFDSKKYAQNTFRVCLDLLKIAKAFGLIASEYVLYDTVGQNDTYLIRPIDRENGEVVVKNFPEDLNIFNEYALTFERCAFMLEKENKKCDLQ